MEYCDNGDLQTKINNAKKTSKFTKENDVWSIFYQMVLGLQALHDRKIIHRDIKPDNIVLAPATATNEVNPDQSDLKLIDFGFSAKYLSSPLEH